MKVYYDRRFHQWCAEEVKGEFMIAAWADSKEAAIAKFNEHKEEMRNDKGR